MMDSQTYKRILQSSLLIACFMLAACDQKKNQEVQEFTTKKDVQAKSYPLLPHPDSVTCIDEDTCSSGVGLLRVAGSRGQLNIYCAAFLISDTQIMTAANCIPKEAQQKDATLRDAFFHLAKINGSNERIGVVSVSDVSKSLHPLASSYVILQLASAVSEPFRSVSFSKHFVANDKIKAIYIKNRGTDYRGPFSVEKAECTVTNEVSYATPLPSTSGRSKALSARDCSQDVKGMGGPILDMANQIRGLVNFSAGPLELSVNLSTRPQIAKLAKENPQSVIAFTDFNCLNKKSLEARNKDCFDWAAAITKDKRAAGADMITFAETMMIDRHLANAKELLLKSQNLSADYEWDVQPVRVLDKNKTLESVRFEVVPKCYRKNTIQKNMTLNTVVAYLPWTVNQKLELTGQLSEVQPATVKWLANQQGNDYQLSALDQDFPVAPFKLSACDAPPSTLQ